MALALWVFLEADRVHMNGFVLIDVFHATRFTGNWLLKWCEGA